MSKMIRSQSSFLPLIISSPFFEVFSAGTLRGRYKKSLRRCDLVAADVGLSATERMEAERCGTDIVIALVKIEIEGPRMCMLS